jgi:hypothetical protein
VPSRCARAIRCPAQVPDGDGGLAADWADGGPYCPRCARTLDRVILGMPARYVWLRCRIGRRDVRAKAPRVSGSQEPRLEYRVEVDELIRDMTLVLGSWGRRVSAVMRLSPPRGRRDQVIIPDAARVLSPHLDVLLGLPAARMYRPRPVTRDDPRPAAGTRAEATWEAGWLEERPSLSGADAGEELFGLAWRCRRLLGETDPPAEYLDGVPCHSCGVLAVYACPDAAYRSECAGCGDLLTAGEYLDWVRDCARKARAMMEGTEPAPAAA